MTQPRLDPETMVRDGAAIDRAIIAQLQRHGRISNLELADRVGLSPSPCLRRVRQLEAAGVIAGYTATVDRAVGRLLAVASRDAARARRLPRGVSTTTPARPPQRTRSAGVSSSTGTSAP